MSSHKLFIVSGPSGSGKGTIVRAVQEARKDFHVSISHTTRTPRPGEVDGTHYHFVTKDAFEEMIEHNAFLEWAQYPPQTGNYYGTARSELTKKPIIILEIELQGARQVMTLLPEAQLIFIVPPSIDALRTRIENRSPLPEEEIRARLSRAQEELDEVSSIPHHTVVNDDGPDGLQKAVSETLNIIDR